MRAINAQLPGVRKCSGVVVTYGKNSVTFSPCRCGCWPSIGEAAGRTGFTDGSSSNDSTTDPIAPGAPR